MVMNKRIVVRKIGSILEIDGEWYQPVYAKQDALSETMRFEKIDKQKMQSLLDSLTNKLKKDLSSKDILRNALADMSLRGLERIDKALKSKTPPKVKRKYGCLDLVVGKTSIPIR